MQELTRQQIKVVQLLAEGYNNLEIADELKITYQAVKNHIYRISQKLGARDRSEVVIYYYQEKIKELEEEIKKLKGEK